MFSISAGEHWIVLTLLFWMLVLKPDASPNNLKMQVVTSMSFAAVRRNTNRHLHKGIVGVRWIAKRERLKKTSLNCLCYKDVKCVHDQDE